MTRCGTRFFWGGTAEAGRTSALSQADGGPSGASSAGVSVLNVDPVGQRPTQVKGGLAPTYGASPAPAE